MITYGDEQFNMSDFYVGIIGEICFYTQTLLGTDSLYRT